MAWQQSRFIPCFQASKLGNKWNGLNFYWVWNATDLCLFHSATQLLNVRAPADESLLLGQAPQSQAAARQGEAQVILAGQGLAMQGAAGTQPSCQPALRKDFIFVRLHLAAAQGTAEEAIPSPRAAPSPVPGPMTASSHVFIF